MQTPNFDVRCVTCAGCTCGVQRALSTRDGAPCISHAKGHRAKRRRRTASTSSG